MSNYQFCPLCGTGLGEIVEEGKTLKHCHACKKFTDYNNPRGVAVAVIPYQGGLVFIKRLVNPRAGKFALPGGFINEGEGPREACIRETFEETGLVVEIVRNLDDKPVPGPNQFLSFYEVKVVGGALKAGSDAGEVRVEKPDTLPTDIAFPLHEAVVKDYVANSLATILASAAATGDAASPAATPSPVAAPAAPAVPRVNSIH